jgi:hypothetical protein
MMSNVFVTVAVALIAACASVHGIPTDAHQDEALSNMAMLEDTLMALQHKHRHENETDAGEQHANATVPTGESGDVPVAPVDMPVHLPVHEEKMNATEMVDRAAAFVEEKGNSTRHLLEEHVGNVTVGNATEGNATKAADRRTGALSLFDSFREAIFGH